MTWHPAHVTGDRRRPKVGDVVAYDHRAWEVTHVQDADPTPEETDRINGFVADYRARSMPYRISLRRVHGAHHERENDAGDIGLRVPAASHYHPQVYPHDRVPLCSCHAQPWPCVESEQQATAEAAMKRAEREFALLPGCCPACQEPITQRQRSIVFPGPYVRNPLASPDPAFHLRRACHYAASRYEDEWVAADPTRARSLLTLRCQGTVVVHSDGSGECFGADGSDCPSVYAQHRCMTACYLQSHGCPQACGTRHGTRLAGYPVDPRGLGQPTAQPTDPSREATP